MERNTLLAILLSSLVLIGFFMAQDRYFTTSTPAPAPVQHERETQEVPWPQENFDFHGDIAATPDFSPDIVFMEEPGIPGEIIPLQTVVIETDVVRVVFSNAGGNIISYQLRRHLDRGEPVEMIFAGDAEPQAFAVAFGNLDDVLSGRIRPVDRNFRVRRISDLIVEFSQDFHAPGGGHFTMIKRYEFMPGEYMFELTIALNARDTMNSFNFRGAAYTLMFAPQIGPRFARLDERHEYRRFVTYRGRLNTVRVNEREPSIITNQPFWAAIVGKYFTLIALPLINNYEIAFSTHAESGLPAAARLFITRPATISPRVEDKFRFYLGPKNQENLIIYDRGDNGFRLRDAALTEVANNAGLWAILTPLENVLKWFLVFFYGLIPNYGVAIILLTLLVRIVMFPLTKKQSEGTIRMQALSPKIKEIQEKHKGNPQKMNQEMA